MSFTVILILITVILSIYAWNNPNIQGKWLFNPYNIKKYHQYYRFISSGFIHSGTLHLFFNMLALYYFGLNVERVFNSLYGFSGELIFAAFYIFGIIISDLPTYFKFKELPHYNSLGASGGVSAIVFSSIMFFPLQKIYIMFIPIGIPGFILGTLYVIYSYYQGKKIGDNINHDAHLYGAVFGVLFTIIIEPQVLPSFLDQISSFSLF